MSADKKVTISLPVLGNTKLLLHFIVSLLNNTKEYSVTFNVVNNSQDPLHIQQLEGLRKTFDINIFDFGMNLGVARSWNFLLEKCYTENLTPFIASSDLIIGSEIDSAFNLILNEEPDTMWHLHASNFFYLPLKVYTELGPYDEFFWPAYYEDCDYIYRVKLKQNYISRKEFLPNEVSVKIEHLKSQTVRGKCSNDIKQIIQTGHQKNKKYYEMKWGGALEAEKYTTPFNL